jgi:hypothetical protein
MFTIFENRIFMVVNISMLFAILLVQGIIFRSPYRLVDSLLGLFLCDLILIFRMKRKMKPKNFREKH